MISLGGVSNPAQASTPTAAATSICNCPSSKPREVKEKKESVAKTAQTETSPSPLLEGAQTTLTQEFGHYLVNTGEEQARTDPAPGIWEQSRVLPSDPRTTLTSHHPSDALLSGVEIVN